MVNQREQKRLARAAEKAAAIQARADAWQARVNTHFAYLQTIYNFHITQVDASSAWRRRITYQTATVGVYVDCNFEVERVEVSLVRLLNGSLPQYPIFILPDTILYEFLHDDLLAIRAPQLLPELQTLEGLSNEQIEASLKFLAKAMNDYAADVLSGDLSIFTTLEERVKQRALERTQTIEIYSLNKPPVVIKVWPPEENPPEWVTRITKINKRAEETEQTQ